MLAVLFVFHLSLNAYGQTEPEYRLEIGAGVGAVSYQGDFNGNIFKEMQPMFTLLAKYRFDPRQAIALNVSHGQLKGSAKHAGTYLPNEWDGYTFKTRLWDVGVRYEYNFWPYGTGMEYRGAKRLTPYIFLGLGATISKPDKTKMGFNVPIGGGVKYKAANRVNVALEWAMHISNNDRLDGAKDAFGIKSSGLFKNTDCYSHLRLSVSYDLWAKCKTCHNDRD